MVMGNAFSSREAVSPIKVIIGNDEPLFKMSLRAQPRLQCVSLAADY
jgi:hypothetical protein